MAEDTRLTYTIPEAGKKLGIGRRLAYELAASGQLPIIRIGGRILVPRAALERMLARSPVGTIWAPIGHRTPQEHLHTP